MKEAAPVVAGKRRATVTTAVTGSVLIAGEYHKREAPVLTPKPVTMAGTVIHFYG
jgi:hypothetical protein